MFLKNIIKIYITYVLLCTIINNMYFISIFFSIVVFFLILAFYRQKKLQSEVLWKKVDPTTDQKNQKIMLPQKINQWKNPIIFHSIIKTINHIFIRLFVFLYTTSIIIFHIHKYSYQQKLLCGQSRHVIDLVVDGRVVSEKKWYNYIVDTKYWFLKTTVFTQPTYKPNQSIRITWTVDCAEVYTIQHTKPILPFSYQLYLYTHKITATIKPKEISIINTDNAAIKQSTSSSLLYPTILHSQNPQLSQFSSQYQWLPEWVLFGITETMSPALYQLFIDSGLVYLVAASWGNIAFVVTLTSSILLFLVVRKRRRIAFGWVFLYAYMLRSNIALIRAFTSYCIVFFINQKWRRISSLQIYSIVVVLLTLYDPYILISSWGFVLSMSWVRGIIMMPHSIWQHRILHYIAPSVRTFLALMWPLLVLTNKINATTIIVSLPAQILAICISYLSLLVLFFWDSIFFISTLLKISINRLIIVAKRAISYKIIISSYSWYMAYILWFLIRSILYFLYKTQKSIKSCHN